MNTVVVWVLIVTFWGHMGNATVVDNIATPQACKALAKEFYKAGDISDIAEGGNMVKSTRCAQVPKVR